MDAGLHSEPPRLRAPLRSKGRAAAAFAPFLEGLLARVSGGKKLDKMYRGLRAQGGAADFLETLLDAMNADAEVAAEDVERIPRSGAVVVVANRPYGFLEGALLARLLRRIRPDVRILADSFLGAIPELRELLLFVEPRGGDSATWRNAAAVRAGLHWLEAGGALAAFPALGVARIDLRTNRIVDPPWSAGIAHIVRRAAADVLPVYFHGTNGPLFQIAGLIAPPIRKVLLPHEFLNKRNLRVPVRVGSLLRHRMLAEFDSESRLAAYLRERTFLLAQRGKPQKTAAPARARRLAKTRPALPAVIAAQPPELLAAEIAALPAESRLAGSGELQVLLARAAQIPRVLREIGRLREVTFRTVGEGSGKPVDLDAFDDEYLHIWLWNARKMEIAGAYRMGPTDELLPRLGPNGFYVHTCFRVRSSFLQRINPALEMGRSFVCQDYQRSFSPLMLLWKGIGQFIVRNPRYRFLYGPVSISNVYQRFSQQLMVEFLRKRHALPAMSRWVKPRLPFRTNPFTERVAPAACAVLQDIEDLSAWVAEIEAGGAGVPILIKHYLRLGGKVLAFNVDPNFSNVVDGLILVDLLDAERSTLDRYMGAEGAASFLATHKHAIPIAG